MITQRTQAWSDAVTTSLARSDPPRGRMSSAGNVARPQTRLVAEGAHPLNAEAEQALAARVSVLPDFIATVGGALRGSRISRRNGGGGLGTDEKDPRQHRGHAR